MLIIRIFVLVNLLVCLDSLAESTKIENPDELEGLAEKGNSSALCLLGMHKILGGELMDPRLIKTMDLDEIIQNKLPLFRKKLESLTFIDDEASLKKGTKLQDAYLLFQKSSDLNNKFGSYLAGCLQIRGFGTNKNKEEGFKKIKKSADIGLARAQKKLGDLLWFGTGCNIDYSQSCVYYNLAAKQGDAEAVADLGWLYKYGQGIEKNIEKAVGCFERSAAMHDPYGLVYLGRCYLYAEGKDKNEVKGMELIKEASEGNGYGKTWLGICYLKGLGVKKDETKAFNLFKEAKDEGDLYGGFMLGQAYEVGWGTAEDDQIALRLYARAAEEDYPEACWALGQKYFYGKGVEKNEAKAGLLFEKGARLGDDDCKWWTKDLTYLRNLAESKNPKAQQFLGTRLREGWFTSQNTREGNKWLEKAFQNGDGKAAALLGDSYEKGAYEKEKDLQKAVEYYGKGSQLGDEQCLRKLGYLSYLGKGLPKDESAAASYYSKAIEKGDVLAKYYLADLYRFGVGVEKNQKKAFDLYSKVINSDSLSEEQRNDARAKLGTYYLQGGVVSKDAFVGVSLFQKSIIGASSSPLGMFFLGYCLYNGLGIDINKDKAQEMFQSAAKRGQQNAMQALKNIQSGKPVTVNSGS